MDKKRSKQTVAKVTFSLRYNKTLHDKLKLIAIQEYTTVTQLIINAINQYVKNYYKE